MCTLPSLYSIMIIPWLGSLVWSGAGGAGGGSRSDRGSKMARKRSRAVSLARVKSVDSGTSLSEEQVSLELWSLDKNLMQCICIDK